jgi:hypothetical protein
MSAPDDNSKVADRFVVIANQYCSLVDSASSMDRTDLLGQIYRILPALIGEAISLPEVRLGDSDDQVEGTNRLNDQEWQRLYSMLKEKLGDWDLYHQVFDPAQDDEAIMGSLADDIADIYRDLKEGLVLRENHEAPPEDIIWEWRLSFYTHWGHHAMNALLTTHFRMQGVLY